jgi:hypothetical protein
MSVDEFIKVKDLLFQIDPIKKELETYGQNYIPCHMHGIFLYLPRNFLHKNYCDFLRKRLSEFGDLEIRPSYKLYECDIITPNGCVEWNSFNEGQFYKNEKVIGKCFLCLQSDKILTREHLPPRCSLNKRRVVCLTAQDLSEGYLKKVLDFTKNGKGKVFNDGVFENRLCDECQKKNYAEDYKVCVLLAKEIKNSQLFFPEKNFIGLIKQVLSMFLVNCSEQFINEYRTSIVNYILNKKNNIYWMPQNLNLWIGFYNNKLARRIGIKSIMANNSVIWYGEISFSPFIFVLAQSNIRFNSLIRADNFQNEKMQQIKLVDFNKFDITDAAGFDWQNSVCLETFTDTLEFLYYRSVI